MNSEEIVTLRNSKPFPGERRDAVSIPADKTAGTTAKGTNSSNSEATADEKTDAGNSQGENEDLKPTEGGNNTDTSDDDSTGRVGKEEAAELDRNLDGDEKGKEHDSNNSSAELDEKTAKVTAMMQRILSLASSGGKGVVPVPLDSEETNRNSGGKPIITPKNCGSWITHIFAVAPESGPSAAKPTIVHNGRLVSFEDIYINVSLF